MELLVLVILAAVALGVVVYPVVRSARRSRDEVPSDPAPGAFDDAFLDREVGRYRDALRAGTACGRCGRANDAGSRFCAECGEPLPAASG